MALTIVKGHKFLTPAFTAQQNACDHIIHTRHSKSRWSLFAYGLDFTLTKTATSKMQWVKMLKFFNENPGSYWYDMVAEFYPRIHAYYSNIGLKPTGQATSFRRVLRLAGLIEYGRRNKKGCPIYISKNGRQLLNEIAEAESAQQEIPFVEWSVWH